MTYPYHIAISANERYMPGALAAASSLAINALPETHLHFHLFTEEVRKDSFDFFCSTIVRLHKNSVITQHVCDESVLAGLPFWAGSRMAAVRCHYANLLPEVDSCLYLDCDVLYLAGVEDHFSHYDKDMYACVVQEESAGTRRNERAWISQNCGVNLEDNIYFNSGVVLFNFRKMREDGIPEKLVAFFGAHKEIPSPDQDALNAIFAGKVKMLPPKYNRLQIFLTDKKIAERPVIHYVSGNPWLPSLKEVASGRFRLWHLFMDKHVWLRKGMSFRKCFARHIIITKYLCYYLLRVPVVGQLVALALQLIGMTADGFSWRRSQVKFDISAKSAREVLK